MIPTQVWSIPDNGFQLQGDDTLNAKATLTFQVGRVQLRIPETLARYPSS